MCSLFDKALTRLSVKQMTAHTLTIKLKYHDFVQITRSKTLPQAITNIEGFEVILADLLKDTDIGTKKIRLLGVALSSLHTSALLNYVQMDLFS